MRPGLVSASLDGAGGGARRVLKLTMDEEEEKNVGELEEEVKKEEVEVEQPKLVKERSEVTEANFLFQ